MNKFAYCRLGYDIIISEAFCLYIIENMFDLSTQTMDKF